MRKILKNKRFMLVAGLAIGLVTLFSHSLRVEIGNSKSQSAEQATESQHQAVIVSPSDAVTVNFLSLPADGFLEAPHVLHHTKNIIKVAATFPMATVPYFRTLFRYIISPNAP
jgi:hypothetical protein